jgi:hypothetical protein
MKCFKLTVTLVQLNVGCARNKAFSAINHKIIISLISSPFNSLSKLQNHEVLVGESGNDIISARISNREHHCVNIFIVETALVLRQRFKINLSCCDVILFNS